MKPPYFWLAPLSEGGARALEFRYDREMQPWPLYSENSNERCLPMDGDYHPTRGFCLCGCGMTRRRLAQEAEAAAYEGWVDPF
jgi:hypothetical protein